MSVLDQDMIDKHFSNKPEIDLEPEVESEEGKSLLGFAENIPSSAWEYVKDATMLIHSPVEFAEGVKALFSKEGIDALGGYYTDRYGSTGKAWETIYEDPVNFLSDISAVAIPTSLAATLNKAISKAGKSGAKKNALRNKLQDYGVQNKSTQTQNVLDKAAAITQNLDPLTLATSSGKGLLSQGILAVNKTFPEDTYENVLKMSVSPTQSTSLPEVRQRIIKTLLENDISIDAQGLKKLEKMAAGKSKALKQMVDAAERDGVKIKVADVLQEVDKLRQEVGNPRTNPDASVHRQAIDKQIDRWLIDLAKDSGVEVDPNTLLTPPDFVGNKKQIAREMTADNARNIDLSAKELYEQRKTIDKTLRHEKQHQTTPSINVRTSEALASGAREGLRDNVSGYAQQGTDIFQLLEAQTPLQRAVNRLNNNNAIGLTGKMSGGVGLMLAGERMLAGGSFSDIMPILTSATAAALLGRVGNKEALARMVYNNRNLSMPEKRTILNTLARQAQPIVAKEQEGERGILSQVGAQ